MPIEAESPEEKGYDTIRYNLAESSVRDLRLSDILPPADLADLVLAYTHHRGDPALRQAVVNNSPGLSPEQVLICPSAATALFIISTALLSANDHLVVIRPNYSTNLETPRAIGCAISFVDLQFENGFAIDVAAVREAVRPNTRLISITNPHNPTGTLYSDQTLTELISLAEAMGCYLLVDETYRDLNFQSERQPYLASRSERVISVCSLSKAFGAPGIRIGWLACRDAQLMQTFLAAKEQIIICNSVLDEAVALRLLQRQNEILPAVYAHIRANFAILAEWFAVNSDLIQWNPPGAGVVGFPRINPALNVDMALFHAKLYHDYQTMVGPGHWFEQPDVFFRIGFGYPTTDELKQGLANIKACLV